MKVVLVGTAELDGRSGPAWDAVRAVLSSLGPQDVVVHTQGPLGAMVDSIARRAKGMERRRLPRVEVQVPEIGRYEREEALRRNAAQLLHVQAPDDVVYVGEGLDQETAAVLELQARAYPRVRVYDFAAFVAERRQR